MSKASLPTHVSFILDGNRRWAKHQHLPTLEGHRQGAEIFREVSLAAFDRGIKYVTAYIFSTENWTRTEEEIGYLMKLVLRAVEAYLDKFHEKGIRIVVLGRKDGLDQAVWQAVQRAEKKTASNRNGTLGLCFNYGGKQELIDAVNGIVRQKIPITSDTIKEHLYVPEIPNIDLLIRTGGEQRLSNFMLWRAAYAELFFIDKFWPDFTTKDLDVALAEYATRQRRFGG